MITRIAGVLLFSAVLALAAVACTDDDKDDTSGAAPTATTAAETPSDGETPADGTGIPDVDDIIDAMLANGPAQVRSRVRFVTEACAIVQGPGGPPPCAEGEPEGTEIEGLPVGTCEGEFRRRDDFEAWLLQVLQVESLFGVYEGPASQGADAEYVAVFEQSVPGQEASVAVSIESGEIVYMKFSCGETAQELVDLLELGEQVG